jgi:putative transcriptional regulator
MTQDQLAKKAGVTRHTIMALEAGKYLPSLLLAFRIAQAFGVGIEEVFELQSVSRRGRQRAISGSSRQPQKTVD